MINIATERLISFAEATDRLPRRRQGRKLNIATLYRWAQHGCRGVVLETCLVGSIRCTSVEALQRFINTLSGLKADGQPKSAPPRGTRASHQRAERELEEAGW